MLPDRNSALPVEIWPGGIFGKTTGFRDRILDKYNPGRFSKRYQFYFESGNYWAGDDYHGFAWLVTCPGWENRVLGWNARAR